MNCVLSLVDIGVLVFCGRRGLEFGGMHNVLAVLVTVFSSVVMVHLGWGTQGGQRCGLVCSSVTLSVTGTSDLGRKFLEETGSHRKGYGEAFGDRVRAASPLYVIPCVGTVVIGWPVNGPKMKRKGGLEIVPPGVKASKRKNGNGCNS